MPLRIGVVLGAGGTVGHAFHAGVLAALADEAGFDAGAADVIVGTSAGSICGALLRSGFSAADLYADALGGSPAMEARRGPSPARPPATDPARPPRRRFGAPPSSPWFAARALATPWTIRPGTLAAALLPTGSIPTEAFAERLRPLLPERWPDDPLWLCAVRLDQGRRVVFGRDAHPVVDPVTAVIASCAIPGYFAPVSIDGARYVDGGAHSPTNLDLVAGLELDLVIVSSPMTYTGPPPIGLDGAARALSRGALWQETRRVRRSGTPVLAFEPTPDDRAAMGLNPMDATRREATARQAYESTRRRVRAPDVQQLLSPATTRATA